MRDAGVDRLAAAVRRRGLSAPAAILLEAHRPIAPLLADAAAFAAPFLSAIGGGILARAIGELEEPGGIDRLARQLARPDERPPGDPACSTPEG
jgi:hypothetical protein